jgi:phosphopentomutase
MPRAFLVVMDSVGCGGAPDADRFFNGDLPDTGANTLGHIAAACWEGKAEEGRSGPLHIPNLDALGWALRCGWLPARGPRGWMRCPRGSGAQRKRFQPGKDTPSGHWELAGLPVPWDWSYFPKTDPAFPDDIVAEVKRLAGDRRHPRQLPRQRDGDHRAAGGGASTHRLADLLHLRRQRLPDRRP